MKNQARALVWFALSLAGCNVEQPMHWQNSGQVEFDLLVVQMPEATALSLIPELRDKKRAGKATEAVLKLVAEKKATLIGWPVIATKSGTRAVVEQIDEFRYATEYDPPGRSIVTKSLPIKGGGADSVKESGLSSTVDTAATTVGPQEPATPSEAKPGETLETTTTVTEGAPTAFETRNIGVTLEIEPVVGSDGRTIDLNLVPRHVRFLGMRKAYLRQENTNTNSVVEQPEFLTNRIATSIQVVDGEHTLLGVFKLSDRPEQIELFILHTRLKRIEVPVGRARTVLGTGSTDAGAGLGP
jgi:hypothetical protein